VPSRRAIWLNRSKVTSCSTSTSPPYGANCAHSTCRRSKPNPRRSAAKCAELGRRSKLADVGRQQSRPARLAVPRLFHQDYTRAELQDRGGLGRHRLVLKREQLLIKLLGHLANEVADAHGTAVRKRVGKVRREDRDPTMFVGARPSFEHPMAFQHDRALALRPRPPTQAQIDPINRYSPPEQKRQQVQPQMMPFHRELYARILSGASR
jgi:hypothetical protein